MKINSIIGVLALTALTACGATQTVQMSSPEALRGKPLHVALERPDPFLPMTREASMFAVAGVVAAAENGKNQVRAFGLSDPSIGVERALKSHIVAKYGLSGSGQTFDFRTSQAPSDFGAWAKANGQSGALLDVRTRGWGYTFNGFSFTEYVVSYGGEMSLIDLDSGRVFAQHMCSKRSDQLNGGQFYTKDQLTASNGRLLKTLLQQLQSACLAEFKAAAF